VNLAIGILALLVLAVLLGFLAAHFPDDGDGYD